MNTIHSERASDEAIHNLCALHGFKAYRTTVNELSGWHVTPKRSRSRYFLSTNSRWGGLSRHSHGASLRVRSR